MTTGKAKADFPGSYIPFDKSVGPVPTVSIDASPTVQICVNEDWLPYLIGCLKALARPETWNDTYDHAVIAASEFAALLGDIRDGCGVVTPSILCLFGSFTDLDYGFVPTPGAGCVAVWTVGTGWQMCADATPQGFLQIKREFGVTTLIREVHLKMTTNVPYLVDVDVTLYNAGTFTNVIHDTAVTGPTLQYDVTGLSEVASAIFIQVLETLGGDAAHTVITDFGLCYTGAFPLSVAPDTFLHEFNFTASDGGFATQTHPSYPNTGHWVSGTGWQTSTNLSGASDSEVLQMAKFFSARFINSLTMLWNAPTASGGGYRQINLYHSGTLVAGLVLNSGSGTFTEVFFPNVLADEVQVVPTSYSATSTIPHDTVVRLVIGGLGTDPF
jgi:hypothetical protein